MRLVYFVFVFVVACSSCYKEADYIIGKGLPGNEVMQILVIGDSVLEADGTSKTAIRVSISQESSAYPFVTLRTNLGKFSNIDTVLRQQVNLDKQLNVEFISGLHVGTAFVKVILFDTLVSDVRIQLRKAYPDSIILSTSRPEVNQGEELDVSMDFFRFKGFMSRDQKIVLSARDSVNRDIGNFFIDSSTIGDRFITGKFVPSIGFEGSAQLVVSLFREDGSVINGRKFVSVR